MADISLQTHPSIISAMGAQERGPNGENRAAIERRRSPRLEVLERTAGLVSLLNVPIALLNISHSGFLMQAPVEYPLGQILEFLVTVAEKDPMVIRARVVHTMRATSGEGTSYISGVEFVDRDSPGCDQARESLFSLLR